MHFNCLEMNCLPLVSVIMPAYNAAPYIRESVASVLDQQHQNLELIIIDDGSTDGTADLIKGIDPRITVLSQENSGPAAARNLGLSKARGEFIAFLDADDLWTPDKLTLQLSFFKENPEFGVVFGGFLRWIAREDGGFDRPPEPEGVHRPADAVISSQTGWIYVPLLYDSIVCIITALVRREALDTVGGFDPAFVTGEDYNLWLRISRQWQAAKLARTLAYYRIHRSSTTHKPRPINNEYVALMSALETWGAVGPDGRVADSERLRERLFMLNFSHGYQHVRDGSARVAVRAFWRAARIRPTHMKTWAYLAASSLKSLGGN